MNGRRSNRTPLYSHSSRVRPPAADSPQPAPAAGPAAKPALAAHGAAAAGRSTAAASTTSAAVPPKRRLALPAWGWALAGALFVGGPLLAWEASRPAPQVITQKHIDLAVKKALETQPLPSPAAKAYEKIRGSVVRVVGLDDDGPVADASGPGSSNGNGNNGVVKPDAGGKKAVAGDAPAHGGHEVGVGSGVVIVDSGLILTNLHVVSGARRVQVVFSDGLESEATVVNVMPENDLAVLRAQRIPDDLQAATLRSTADLHPGERVTAVGFPFGIGPTVSSGVVSGLKREFRSPEGKQVLSNLIQFDAMANPGSSGGPLVTDDGEVVGIVTAILNPVQQRFFVGIGFAVPIENAAGGAGLPPF
ncbi:S1C family serine protease [Azohydromonas lata]|uniref:Trypsin-like peptidase domain-containing protein n=1 Tax=Azohydromonas lata TaxID=45677 RepID=A0ABU5IDX1_9BURK|nr:trypsin-like peptidase domain-containing protein [Azohydromonas lata]MDZ5457318.1 trypsin-like peptidase domain-containing protein [Azohydromonas lata]